MDKTIFNNDENKLIHDIGGGYSIISYLNIDACTLIKDGCLMDSYKISNMNISEYFKHIETIKTKINNNGRN